MPLSAVDIEATIAPLPVFKNRTPVSDGAEVSKAFATLAKTENGGVFAGSFEGTSAWERHSNGDELVHILNGETRLTVLVDGVENILDMKAGQVTVVPRGCWHRFDAPAGVTVMTMTPQPTDHSTADIPTGEAAG